MQRSCYKTWVKFFRDSEALTQVEWFFTSAPPLPFAHQFYPRFWISEDGEWPTDLGEVCGGRTVYSKGRRVGSAPAIGWCGTVDQWQNGCLIADALDPSALGPDGITPT